MIKTRTKINSTSTELLSKQVSIKATAKSQYNIKVTDFEESEETEEIEEIVLYIAIIQLKKISKLIVPCKT